MDEDAFISIKRFLVVDFSLNNRNLGILTLNNFKHTGVEQEPIKMWGKWLGAFLGAYFFVFMIVGMSIYEVTDISIQVTLIISVFITLLLVGSPKKKE